MRAFRRVVTSTSATCVAVVVVAGIAAAYYTGDAVLTATGSATPFDASATLSLNATGVVSSGLYPGGPGATVTVTVANPYAVPVVVTSVVGAGSISPAPLAGRTCVTHGVSLVAPSSGLPVTVPASSSVSVALAGVAVMSNAAENGCQGATFTIPFHVIGRLS